MKSGKGARRGSALPLALIITIVCAGLATAFITLMLAQNQVTSNASESEMALYVAESGIDAAVNELNAGVDYGNDGIGNVTGQVNGGAFTVALLDTDGVPTVFAGEGEYMLRSVGVREDERRGIEAIVGPESKSLFTYAAFGDKSLSTNPATITDSWDSTQGTYGSQAVNPSGAGGANSMIADRNGNVGGNGNLDISGRVFGNASPGVGGQITYGANGYVSGTVTALDSPMSLPPIEPGNAASNNNNASLIGRGYDPATGSFKATGGSVTFQPGVYYFETFESKPTSQIVINGPVKIYVKGFFQAGGFTNTSQDPANLQVYIMDTSNRYNPGTGQNQPAELGGGTADFYGLVYAPDAWFKYQGKSAFYGSLIAGDVQIGGGGAFHWDENLARLGGVPTYKARMWREFVP
ncbi:MAG: pilus assembly PilX N-terminal domain-containing protein [Planctomycetes bacterium]|nr:pilus assembly PilX N-terminal domain-containing protein [Planctomycetota bacterium]